MLAFQNVLKVMVIHGVSVIKVQRQVHSMCSQTKFLNREISLLLSLVLPRKIEFETESFAFQTFHHF